MSELFHDSPRGAFTPFFTVYHFREKPTVLLYSYYIDRHAGTPKQREENITELLVIGYYMIPGIG